MDIQSSAGPQFLGYIYQIPYSLLLVLESEEDTEHAIRLEGLDDIESWSEDNIRELVQLKHHKDPRSTLTDRSVDLWRPIRIWSQHLREGRVKVPDVMFKLITTSVITEHSVAWLLSPLQSQRDTLEAYRRLVAIATQSSETLRPFTQTFLSLEPSRQKELVDSIQVLADAPDLAKIHVELIKRIRAAAPIEHKEQLYDMLIGWWARQVISHVLNDSTSMLTANAVWRQINEIGRYFAPDALPPYSKDEEFDIPKELMNYQFVLQLERIGVGQRRISRAIQDYIKAKTDRLRWVRERLLFDEVLLGYNKSLVERWEEVCDTMDDTYKLQHQRSIRETDEQDCKRFGHDVYTSVSNLEIPIHYNSPAYRYITHGSYQILADEKKPPEVWWHPKYVEQVC